MIRGQWVDPTDTTTVAELVRRRADSRVLKPRTRARIESMIKNHVEGTTLGARRMAKVRPSEAQDWTTGRAGVMAPGTLRLLVTLVKGAFDAAVHDHLVGANPFDRVRLPRAERERIVPLTVNQVAAIAAVIRPRYRTMVIAQAGLGLPIGELLALRVQDIDICAARSGSSTRSTRLTRELVEPKTARSRRTVPLPAVVGEALAKHIGEHPPTASGLLFHTRDGMPIQHDWYGNKVFVPAALKAGCPAGTTSHDLRHHYASVLLAAGESVVAVAERLGHDSAQLVLTTYGHLLPDLEDRTRRAVDDAWNTVSDAPERSPTAQGRPG